MNFRKELAKELGVGVIAENTMLDDYVKACEAIAVRYHETEVKKLQQHSVSGKQLLFEFVEWYSGMQKEKIMRAYQKWQKEVACASGTVDTVAAGGYCECSFAMIMRNQETQIGYCAECGKEIDEQ